MVLATHSDAGFHNESKARGRDVSHIFLSEEKPDPRCNGLILTIAQVINFFMCSAVEAEVGAIFITAKELLPIRQALIETGCTHPPTPIQLDNSTESSVANDTIIVRKNKSMDLRLHLLRCCESQQQFRFYWAPGSKNWANYSTKHHLPIYHESKRPLFTGTVQKLYQALLAQ